MLSLQNIVQQEFRKRLKEQIDTVNKQHYKELYTILYRVKQSNTAHAKQVQQLKRIHAQQRSELKKYICQQIQVIFQRNIQLDENEDELREKSSQLKKLQQQLAQTQQRLITQRQSFKAVLLQQKVLSQHIHNNNNQHNIKESIDAKQLDIQEIIKKCMVSGDQKLKQKYLELTIKDKQIKTLKQQLQSKENQFQATKFKLRQFQQENQTYLKTINQPSQKSALKLLKQHSNSAIVQNKNNNQIKAYCSGKNLATHLCRHQSCKQNAFICQDSDCNCWQGHLICKQIMITELLNKIKQKKISTQPLETFLNDKIQEIINLLVDFHYKTISQIKQDFQFYGLSNQQNQFINELKNGKTTDIKGSKIWEIFNSEIKQQTLTKSFGETLKSLQRTLNHSKESVEQTIKLIAMQVKDCQKMQNFLFTQSLQNYLKQKSKNGQMSKQIQLYSSKIINSLTQFKVLQSLFAPRYLKSIKLLYRASQNEFQVRKFHEKCDGVSDTLVLIETQFGNKIGGYTPIKWQSPQWNEYKSDEQKLSFLFSLTNGDKFNLKSKDHAVYHNAQWGPTFGLKCDLLLGDKADSNNCACVNINGTYKNEKYSQYKDKDGYMRFSGSPDPSSLSFDVKEWQVWEIEFEVAN